MIMILKTLFGQRKCKYPGEYGPEVLACWDEFSIEENAEGFENECATKRATLASEFYSFCVIDISVRQETVERLLNESPQIAGKVLVPEQEIENLQDGE